MNHLSQLFHFILENSKPNWFPTCKLKLFLKHSGFINMWIKIKDFANPIVSEVGMQLHFLGNLLDIGSSGTESDLSFTHRGLTM